MIKVSVIIPNYNHAKFLRERIDSVLNQSYSPSEVIILDDHSTDKSREVIEQYRSNPAISHIIYNEENSGSPFKQWKKGILQAKEDWVWIAESDDIADHLFLETANKVTQQNSGTGIFYCDSECRQEGNTPLRYKFFAELKNQFFKTTKWSSDYTIKGEDEINENLKFVCTINNTSAAVFRKDLLLNILNKLETYIYHGDWYCQLAVVSHTNISYSAKALNTFRMHENSFLRHTNALQSKLECFRILDYLYKQDSVSSKKKVIDFFTLQYLGFGFMKDGYRYGKNLFASYAAINKPLSQKVFRSLIWQKITGKKHRVIF
jgi:glycosyltransferase involved in cell wall biosynthesis